MQDPVSTFLRLDSYNNFPKGFIFGAASSAFQIEGAANEDGRGPSIWDEYCKNKDWKVGNAIDHYHKYKEDVAMMKWMGLDAYRFSISWSRILPTGRKSGGLNFEGVKFYKDLIKELLKNGIKPHVTLLHWDVPQELEKEYGGFRKSQIVNDFGEYADICFLIFGNDVKHWTTINKPWSFSEGGYASGNLAPGRGEQGDNSEDQTENSECDPAREPYIVTHNQLLAHAKAVEVYRTKYKKTQKGGIGIALNSFWFEPASQSKENKKAKERALDFTLNWFLDPITAGHYPDGVEKIMKERKIDHEFSQKGPGAVKGSIDFLGIDYYTAICVRDKPGLSKENDANYMTDYNVQYRGQRPLGENWPDAVFNVYPQGLKDLLIYVKSKYNKGPIYIAENGFGERNNDSLSRHEALHDDKRLSYLHHHLSQIMDLTKKDAPEKVNIKGYFAWTMWDNFEWTSGFNVRYGLIHVDFKNNLRRTPKYSAHWLKYIIQKRKDRKSGLTDTESGLSSLSTRSVAKASLQPGAMNRDVGRRVANSVSNDFNTMSASSLDSNNFGTTNTSRRHLESATEYESEFEYDQYETDANSDGPNELESGSEIEEDQESDKDSDPAHGFMDEEDDDEEVQESDKDSDPAHGFMEESDEDVNSAPTRPVARRKFR